MYKWKSKSYLLSGKSHASPGEHSPGCAHRLSLPPGPQVQAAAPRTQPVGRICEGGLQAPSLHCGGMLPWVGLLPTLPPSRNGNAVIPSGFCYATHLGSNPPEGLRSRPGGHRLDQTPRKYNLGRFLIQQKTGYRKISFQSSEIRTGEKG